MVAEIRYKTSRGVSLKQFLHDYVRTWNDVNLYLSSWRGGIVGAFVLAIGTYLKLCGWRFVI
jgi:hypothetical protein